MTEEVYTDNELLYMIRQQDDWAVESLLNKYKPMICGMIFRLGQFENCSVSGDAYKEDLEQESRMMLVSAYSAEKPVRKAYHHRRKAGGYYAGTYRFQGFDDCAICRRY